MDPHEPKRCCNHANHRNFMDWHQWSLLYFLGLVSSSLAEGVTPALGTSIGLLDEPQQLNWIALLVGTIIGLVLFIVACLLAGKRLATISHLHERLLKEKLKKRR